MFDIHVSILFQTMAKGEYKELHIALTSNAVIVQLLFTFCYFGDRLTTIALEMNEAAYDIPWYRFPIKQQKFMLPIILRCQKQFVLSGCGLTSLSLQSFKEVSLMFVV